MKSKKKILKGKFRCMICDKWALDEYWCMVDGFKSAVCVKCNTLKVKKKRPKVYE